MFTFKEQLLHESSLSRIYQHTKESNMGIVTAYRGEFSKQQNEKRNANLKSDIQSAKFGYVSIEGHYIENLGTPEEKHVVEQSFVVISAANDSGRLKGFLRRMGAKYDQDSVLYKDASSPNAVLIGTVAGRWPGLNTEVDVGAWQANKIGQYYSKMKGHRTFKFESVEVPEGLMSKAYREKFNKL